METTRRYGDVEKQESRRPTREQRAYARIVKTQAIRHRAVSEMLSKSKQGAFGKMAHSR